MDYERQISALEARIKELEERVTQLRFSRRVLMNLVEKLQQEKNCDNEYLLKENRRLQHNNIKFAQSLLQKNKRIVELENNIRSLLVRLGKSDVI